MTHIEQAIRDAIDVGGYEGVKNWNADLSSWEVHRQIWCDPEFWKHLGKARGWGVPGRDKTIHPRAGAPEYEIREHWVQRWHRFIDHLAEGKDAESFFENI